MERWPSGLRQLPTKQQGSFFSGGSNPSLSDFKEVEMKKGKLTLINYDIALADNIKNCNPDFLFYGSKLEDDGYFTENWCQDKGIKLKDFSFYFENFKENKNFETGLKRISNGLNKGYDIAILTKEFKELQKVLSDRVEKNYITIIGTRDITPDDEKNIAYYTKALLNLDPLATDLTGGATGSDTVGANNSDGRYLNIIVDPNKVDEKNVLYPASDKLQEMVCLLHPNPLAAASPRNGSFLCRDLCQVLFPGIEDRPDAVTRMVVFCADENRSRGEVKGGTAMAVSLARLLEIPTFNLRNGRDREKLDDIIKNGFLPPIRTFNSSYLKPGIEDMFDVLLTGCRGKSRKFLKEHTIRGFFENDGPLRFVSQGYKEKVLEK